jgi:hypothetical protein
LTNDTISNNTVSDNGGGIYNRADAIVLNVTLSGNIASGSGTGGNIYNDGASLAIKNSILADSDTDGNCFNNDGIFTSQGWNLDSGNTCGFNGNGDLTNTKPLLGPLQDNGGFTSTHALSFGSPAIDSGTNTGCPATDQRGFSRPLDGDSNGSTTCDIGSYEVNSLSPPTVTPSLTPEPTQTSTPTFTPTTPVSTDTPTSTPVPPTQTPIPPVPPCSNAIIALGIIALVFRLRIR